MGYVMSKFQEIYGVKTAYEEEGSGRDVILLHGWGQNKEMMSCIFEHLKTDFHVFSLDFPGFGESQDPPEAWGVGDYEAFLQDFIQKNSIRNPILIGHSFGCRVAIRYSAEHPGDVNKMCLTGAAGIRPKRGMDWYIRTYTYKAGKAVLKMTGQTKKLEELQNRSGSEDYRNAKGVMRPTFVKVVNEDLTPYLKQIRCPVLLVWGEYDTAAPLWMGKKMEEEIPDAGLAVFEGDDHWAYWHQADRFNRVLDVFLKGDKA